MAWVQSPADHSLAVREQRVLVETLLGYKEPGSVLGSSWHSGKVGEQPDSTVVCLANRPVHGCSASLQGELSLNCLATREIAFVALDGDSGEGFGAVRIETARKIPLSTVFFPPAHLPDVL